MTRAQAGALSLALASQHIAHEIVFSYDGGGAETASAQLGTKIIYTASQLAALANYCTTNGLSLSIQIASMGVV